MGIDINATLQCWRVLHLYTIALCLLPEFSEGIIDPTVVVDGWWPCLADMGLGQYW
jgi:hypothetical protein